MVSFAQEVATYCSRPKHTSCLLTSSLTPSPPPYFSSKSLPPLLLPSSLTSLLHWALLSSPCLPPHTFHPSINFSSSSSISSFCSSPNLPPLLTSSLFTPPRLAALLSFLCPPLLLASSSFVPSLLREFFPKFLTSYFLSVPPFILSPLTHLCLRLSFFPPSLSPTFLPKFISPSPFPCLLPSSTPSAPPRALPLLPSFFLSVSLLFLYLPSYLLHPPFPSFYHHSFIDYFLTFFFNRFLPSSIPSIRLSSPRYLLLTSFHRLLMSTLLLSLVFSLFPSLHQSFLLTLLD